MIQLVGVLLMLGMGQAFAADCVYTDDISTFQDTGKAAVGDAAAPKMDCETTHPPMCFAHIKCTTPTQSGSILAVCPTVQGMCPHDPNTCISQSALRDAAGAKFKPEGGLKDNPVQEDAGAGAR